MSARLPVADYLVVGVYLVAVLVAGFWFARSNRTGTDFFIGGNRIPWWAAGVSLYMTTFSAWMFTGAASFIYNTGWFGLFYLLAKPVGFAGGFLLTAVRWRRSRISSPVEYVEERFNHPTRLVLSVVLVVSMMYWPAHHLASVARISAPALFPGQAWAIDALILFFGVFVLVYSVAGGIWAVSMTDVLQFLVLLAVCVGLIVAIFISGDIQSPSDLVSRLPPLQLRHEVRSGTIYTHWYLIGFAVSGMFGMVVGDKAQRFFSVKDEKAALKVGWIAFFLFLTSPLLFGLPPLVGKILWPDPSQLVEFAGATKPDESIFIGVVMRYMPVGVVGLFLAAMVAASMSALDSVWNTVSAIVSVDLYKGHINPDATERQLLVIGRVTIVVLAFFAVGGGLLIVHSSLGIFTISNIVLGLVAIPVTIPLFIGIVSRTPVPWSAVPAILSGVAVAAVARFDLDWTLGPQYLAVALVCLVVLFSSRPLARAYQRSAVQALLLSVALSALLLGALSVFDAPTMSGGYRSGFSSATLIVALGLLAAANFACSRVYARTLAEDDERVGRFFKRIETPIDVSSELGESHVAGRPGRLIGWASFGMALVPAILLVHSRGASLAVYSTLIVVFVGCGVLFLRAGGDAAAD